MTVPRRARCTMVQLQLAVDHHPPRVGVYVPHVGAARDLGFTYAKGRGVGKNVVKELEAYHFVLSGNNLEVLAGSQCFGRHVRARARRRAGLY